MDSRKPDRLTEYETAEAGWNCLARCLEEFSAAWQTKIENRQIENPQIENGDTLVAGDNPDYRSFSPPDLSEFLPDDKGTWRSVTLVELIKLDMEYRSQGHSPWKPLEQYRDEWPELQHGGRLPADLLYEEFQIRKRMNDGVGPEEYEQRFPGERGTLTRLLTSGDTQTSALYHSRTPSSFEVGDRVDDFDLLTRLGKGAFATVFLARQNSMQRIVALKISANQGHEPQTLAQLDHPHIVRVYDQRIIRNPPARLLYMQHIAGGTLDEVVAEARRLAVNEELGGKHLVEAIDHLLEMQGEPIPVKSGHRRRLARSSWAEVVSQIGNEIAHALFYAHEQGVLHRDLKPANVLLDKDGHVKLVDFNISFCSKVDGASPAAYFGGSLAYMSPEQLEACNAEHDRQPDSLDGRSDIFSTGVMLFEMLTGHRPYVDDLKPDHWADTLQRMVEDRRRGIPEESGQYLSSGSGVLGKTIARCLNGCPEKRYADGNSLATSLAWARNPRSGLLFQRPDHLASRFANRTPFFVVGLLTMGISLVAVLFILTYNLEKAVPVDAKTLFQDKLVPWQNLLLFAIGGILIFWLTRPVSRCLRAWRHQPSVSPHIVNRAIERNLNLGHLIAIMSAVEWTIGGALLPLMLVLSGYSMDLKSVFDFVSSHFLAGLITGAYVFWLVSFLALHVWQPRLLEAALASDAELDWSRRHHWLDKLFGFYHFLAVSVPLTGIAWLVLYEGSTESGSLNPGTVDKRSLGTLCVVALLGLVLLVWTSRRVRSGIDVQKSFNPRQDEF